MPNEAFYQQTGQGDRSFGTGMGNVMQQNKDPNVLAREIAHASGVANQMNSVDVRYLGAFKLEEHKKQLSEVQATVDALESAICAARGVDRSIFGHFQSGWNTGDSQVEVRQSKRREMWNRGRMVLKAMYQMIIWSEYKGIKTDEEIIKISDALTINFEGEQKPHDCCLKRRVLLTSKTWPRRAFLARLRFTTTPWTRSKTLTTHHHSTATSSPKALNRLITWANSPSTTQTTWFKSRWIQQTIGFTEHALETAEAADKASDAIEVKNEKYFIEDQYYFQGLPIKIENKVGSVRSGVDPDGNDWSVTMGVDYGFIMGYARR